MEMQKKRRDFSQILLTAVLALAILTVLYKIRDLYPCGDGSILLIDLHTQYMPLLYRFYDVVAGQKNLFWDLSVSGGANLYADTVNELLNPFNYLLLPFGRSRLYLAVNVLLAAYCTGSAVTACLALQRLWPKKREWNVSLSLAYAFSGYMAYQYQIIRWLYLPVLFPLFVLALLRVFREKKWGWYALLTAYQLMLSLQLGVMTLLFTLFAGGLILHYQGKDRERSERIWCLAVGTVTGLLLAAVVLLPEILLLLHSARAGENQGYLAVMTRHGLDDLFERLFQIAHPVLLAMPVYFGIRCRRQLGGAGDCAGRGAGRKKRCPGKGIKSLGKRLALWRFPREGKYLLAWNLFLGFTVIAQPSNLLWHLGSYMCFPVRYAYMVLWSGILFIKWMAVWTEGEKTAVPVDVRAEETADAGEASGKAGKAACHGGASSVRFIRMVICAALGIVCLLAAAAGSLLWAEQISQAFSSLAISSVCPGEALRVSGLLFLLFLGALLLLESGGGKRPGLILSACICGGCFFLFLLLPQSYGVRQMNEAAYERMNEEYALQTGQEEAELFVRLEDDADLPLNAALVMGGRSMTGYFPSGSENKYAEGMEKLGYLTPWVSTRSWGGTAISDAFFGIRRGGTEGAAEREEANVLFTGGLALAGDLDEIGEGYEEAAEQGPLAVQSLLGQLFTGEAVLTQVDMGSLERQEDGSVCVKVTGECRLYLDAGLPASDLAVWINGEAAAFPEGGLAESPHRLLYIGAFCEEEVRLQITDRSGGAIALDGMLLGILDWDVWTEAAEQIRANDSGRSTHALRAEQLQIQERKGTITIYPDQEMAGTVLLLPISVLKGWSGKADGQSVEVYPAFGGFWGIVVPEGAEEITFRFVPAGFKAGLALSLLGLLLAAAGAVCGRRRAAKGEAANAAGEAGRPGWEAANSTGEAGRTGGEAANSAGGAGMSGEEVANSAAAAGKSGKEAVHSVAEAGLPGAAGGPLLSAVSGLYRVILLVAFAGIYLIPNVGLLIYIVYKVAVRLF